MTQGERISLLEKNFEELENLLYKISGQLTSRIWKLENPGKDIQDSAK